MGLSASATSKSITFYACSVKTTGVLSATSTKAPTCARTATLVTWNSVATSLSGIQFVKGYVIQEDANLMNANLMNANLTNANLSYANLHSANLSYANLTNADLYYANLSGANLYLATLTGANLTGATCPNGIVHGQSNASC